MHLHTAALWAPEQIYHNLGAAVQPRSLSGSRPKTLVSLRYLRAHIPPTRYDRVLCSACGGQGYVLGDVAPTPREQGFDASTSRRAPTSNLRPPTYDGVAACAYRVAARIHGVAASHSTHVGRVELHRCASCGHVSRFPRCADSVKMTLARGSPCGPHRSRSLPTCSALPSGPEIEGDLAAEIEGDLAAWLPGGGGRRSRPYCL